jgi:hypothetical protein
MPGRFFFGKADELAGTFIPLIWGTLPAEAAGVLSLSELGMHEIAKGKVFKNV